MNNGKTRDKIMSAGIAKSRYSPKNEPNNRVIEENKGCYFSWPLPQGSECEIAGLFVFALLSTPSLLCLEIISWTKSRYCKFRRHVYVMTEGNRPYETTLYTCLPTSGNMKEFIDRMSIADPLLNSCSLWPLQGNPPRRRR